MVLLIGVTLEVMINGVPVVIKGEPRPAIVAFLFATLWEFFHLEWMTHCHQKKIDYEPTENEQVTLNAMRFQSGWNSERNPLVSKSPKCLRLGMYVLITTVIGLFLAGSLLDCIRFTSVLAGEAEGCVRSYNLYTLGTAFVSDFFLHLNKANAATWILFLAYIICIIVLPLFVHLVHALVCLFNVKGKRLCLLSDMCWTFASVDVLLIAVITAQVSTFFVCSRSMAG